MKRIDALVTLFLAVSPAFADEHQVTVYSQAPSGALQARMFEAQAAQPDRRFDIPGFAVIRSLRPMALQRGLHTIRFDDVAAGIDPTTVSFESLTDPDARVLEQSYRYDLVSTDRILQRYLGETLTVRQAVGDQIERHVGRLLSAHGGEIVLDRGDGLVSLRRDQATVEFPQLPEGLITRPTLEWQVETARGGEQRIQIAYETSGMTWWADYNLIHDDGDRCRMDLGAWVTLVNQSGGSFDQARLKLVAGDVHRASAPRPAPMMPRREVMAMAAADGFSEKAFFEYHLYTLGRNVDLPDRSVKQLELFPTAQDAPCRRRLLFDAGQTGLFHGNEPITGRGNPGLGEAPVRAFLEFENREDEGLGMPLPAGRVRVSQRDPADGSLELIGEDRIDHTPRNESVALELGNAFDVVGERRQAAFSWNQSERWAEETIEVELRNRKTTETTVTVRESMFRWSNWSLDKSSHGHRQIDASTLEFDLDIDADSVSTLRYTVRYSW